MDLGVAGRVALVAGGPRGIGGAVAALLAAEGARVVLVGGCAEDVEDGIVGIRHAGGEVAGVVADMTDEGGIGTALEGARAAFGSPQIVVTQVNCEDAADSGSTLPSAYAAAYEAIALGVVTTARAVIPAMRVAGWGRLVNVLAGTAGHPSSTAHAITSMPAAALASFSTALASEVGPYGITVNNVATGMVATDALTAAANDIAMRNGSSEAEVLRLLTRASPLRRPGLPAEVAHVVAMLCSPQGGFVNGQCLLVDGGARRQSS